MEQTISDTVKALIDKGVVIRSPSSVEIADEVNPSQIAKGVTIYPGCRIYGEKTLIMNGAKLGAEAPVTIQDCQIGPDVELKGGFFKKSVFLAGANMAYGAHVRDACILEEEAGGAHTVGLKQTILLPFVTLGSLINFCDCMMSGGTSRKDHSEVGSSYIHFNYTPNQDKATASLIGDVPRGVMLNQRPIFLGGQGGLVGPAKIGFGTVIAAGTVFRGSLYEDSKIVYGQDTSCTVRAFKSGVYWEINQKVRNNITYIANLIALKAWYRHVRPLFFGPDPMEQGLLAGAVEKLDMALDERIKRFKALAEKMPESVLQYTSLMKDTASADLINQKQGLYDNIEQVRFDSLRSYCGDDKLRDTFLSNIEQEIGRQKTGYIETIQRFHGDTRSIGTQWLINIVEDVNSMILEKLPMFR
ncbi:MAG: UDP-N-acetylglucosamine pyrophosphorylase [Thermodesulfobacteriota bacterium]|nr:UDP-N-acetylglucosamine pyrophosphorylase [Thermodesulfobacteriota bacterium]